MLYDDALEAAWILARRALLFSRIRKALKKALLNHYKLTLAAPKFGCAQITKYR
jgi:hypothetical protein